MILHKKHCLAEAHYTRLTCFRVHQRHISPLNISDRQSKTPSRSIVNWIDSMIFLQEMTFYYFKITFQGVKRWYYAIFQKGKSPKCLSFVPSCFNCLTTPPSDLCCDPFEEPDPLNLTTWMQIKQIKLAPPRNSAEFCLMHHYLVTKTIYIYIYRYGYRYIDIQIYIYIYIDTHNMFSHFTIDTWSTVNCYYLCIFI